MARVREDLRQQSLSGEPEWADATVRNRPQRTVTGEMRELVRRPFSQAARASVIAVLVEGVMQAMCEAARRHAP
jgi:hypothetical protein